MFTAPSFYTRTVLNNTTEISQVLAVALALTKDVDLLTETLLRHGIQVPDRITVTRMEAQANGDLPPDMPGFSKLGPAELKNLYHTQNIKKAVDQFEFDLVQSPFDALATHPEYEKKIAEQLFKASRKKQNLTNPRNTPNILAQASVSGEGKYRDNVICFKEAGSRCA